MDREETAAAVRRLRKGGFVDAQFDLGEHDSAKEFMRELASLGLQSELHDDYRPAWYGSRPRPWFVKYAVGGSLAFSSLWIIARMFWPESAFHRLVVGMLGLFVLSIPYVYSIRRKGPKTPEQVEHEEALQWRIVAGLFIAFVVGSAIIQEPWLGVAILAIAAGAAVFVMILRAMNKEFWQ